MLTRTDDADGFTLTSDHGSARLRMEAPGVVVISYRGVIGGDVVPDLQTRVDEVIRTHGKIWFFVDAAELTSYHTAFRKLWTVWLKDNRPNMHELHLLIRSRIVQMGVNLVNPLIGNYIVGHSQEQPFRDRIQRAVEQATQPAAE